MSDSEEVEATYETNTWHCWDCETSGIDSERRCWNCGSTDPSVVKEKERPQPAAFSYDVRADRYDPEPFGFEAGPPTDYDLPRPFPPAA